jgi:hypothetical protein
VVRPEADPGKIRFSVEGARSLRVNAQGDLLAETSAGPVVWKAPVTYQGSGTGRRTVSAGYRLNGRSVSFRLGEYDRSRPLVIDPVLVYSTYLGGSDWDVADGVATDAAGNAIVVGWTWSYDFPVSPGAYSTQILGDLAGFVAKLSADGKTLLWATYLGGLKGSGLYSVARDRDGNLWTTGDTYASDFPTTEDAFDRTYNGFVDRDAVLAKLSANGDALLYSTYIGGGQDDGGSIVRVYPDGDVVVAGETYSANFPTTPGAYDTSQNGDLDAFVLKLHPGTDGLTFSTFLGGTGPDTAWGCLAVDADGSIFTAGETGSVDFPTTASAYDASAKGDKDAFVAKLNATGSELLYSTYLGGGQYDSVWGMTVDAGHRAWLTGETASTDFPVTPDAIHPQYGGGGWDAFLARMGADGKPEYATFLGGSGTDWGSTLARDAEGRIYVVGSTASPDFPVTRDATDRTYNGGDLDAFVSVFEATGKTPVFSTFLGGPGTDRGLDIALDGAGDVTITGRTESDGLQTTTGAYDTTYNGTGPYGVYGDGFVAKWSMSQASTQPPYTMADAAAALRMAGGLEALDALDRYNVEDTGSSADRVDMMDVVYIARRAAGLDPNP